MTAEIVSGFSTVATATGIADGAFGAVAPTLVDGLSIGSVYWRGPGGGGGTHLVLTAGLSGNPCCHCGCGPGGFYGFSSGDTFPSIIGTLVPALLSSIAVYGIAQGFNPVTGFTASVLSLQMPTGTPQNAFTALEITDSLLGDQIFTSAAATFNDPVTSGFGPNFSLWQWSAPAQLFADATVYHLIFT